MDGKKASGTSANPRSLGAFGLPSLPETVISEILAQLPVKSLLRFRSVCKSWLSMISEPHFVKTHLKYADENLRLRRHIVFDKYKIGNSLDIICVDYETHERASISNSPFKNLSENPEILGSCNGLLLVGLGQKAHILWNPSTRKQILEFTERHHFHDYQRLYGLCYDCSTDAYKVVRVVRVSSCPRHNEYSSYDSTRASFYNSKAKSWKKFEHFPYMLFTNAQGVLVNGNLHFVVVRNNRHMDRHPHGITDTSTAIIPAKVARDYVIIYFDVVEDKFKELPKPDWLNRDFSFEMGTLGGLLCLAQHVQYRMSSLMWVMKQYGVGDSWCPMGTINTEFSYCWPLYLKKNGAIMLVEKDDDSSSRTLSAYSSVGTDTTLQVISYRNQNGFDSSPYVESLVSPLEAE